MINSRGFKCELYVLNTSGYPLTIYKIINPLANPNTLNKYPVLYGHGLLYDSHSMITRSESSKPRVPTLGKPTVIYQGNDGSSDMSLPFMLSNNNFEVWMYDARGTNGKNRNATVTDTINPIADKYWDFSLDDQSLSDLPLFIDFVLTKTGASKLVYVGYSESTLFMFALLSTEPRYADKIAAAVLMAPVAYVEHLRGFAVPMLGPLAAITPEFFHQNYVPQFLIDFVDKTLKLLCSRRAFSRLICGEIFNGIGGKGSGENFPDFYARFFQSTSLKSIKHFIQLFQGKRFGMYDYGPVDNLIRYKQVNPPAYNVGRIVSDRIILVRGSADFLSTAPDQERLIAEMGVKPFKDIVIPSYNHFDFIDGTDLIRLVNEPVIRAVYELMYRDGPNIIGLPSKIGTIPSAPIITPAISSPMISGPPVGTPVISVPVAVGAPVAPATAKTATTTTSTSVSTSDEVDPIVAPLLKLLG